MKSAIDIAETSDYRKENNVLNQMMLLLTEDTIKLIESDIQEAANLGLKNHEIHIRDSVHKAVINELRDNGYAVQMIGVDHAAGSAHINISW